MYSEKIMEFQKQIELLEEQKREANISREEAEKEYRDLYMQYHEKFAVDDLLLERLNDDKKNLKSYALSNANTSLGKIIFYVLYSLFFLGIMIEFNKIPVDYASLSFLGNATCMIMIVHGFATIGLDITNFFKEYRELKEKNSDEIEKTNQRINGEEREMMKESLENARIKKEQKFADYMSFFRKQRSCYQAISENFKQLFGNINNLDLIDTNYIRNGCKNELSSKTKVKSK